LGTVNGELQSRFPSVFGQRLPSISNPPGPGTGEVLPGGLGAFTGSVQGGSAAGTAAAALAVVAGGGSAAGIAAADLAVVAGGGSVVVVVADLVVVVAGFKLGIGLIVVVVGRTAGAAVGFIVAVVASLVVVVGGFVVEVVAGEFFADDVFVDIDGGARAAAVVDAPGVERTVSVVAHGLPTLHVLPFAAAVVVRAAPPGAPAATRTRNDAVACAFGEPGAPRGGTLQVSVPALRCNVSPSCARSVAFVVTRAWFRSPARLSTTVAPPGSASWSVALSV